MAEPARNLYDEDKPENKNDPSPRFEVHKGGGETTTPKKGHLKSVDDSGQSSKSEKDLYTEGDKKLSASKAEELEARQLGVKPENKDSLYNIKAEAPTNLIKKNKKTAAFMAVAATMVVGISIFFFVILAPLKILHIVNNLQDRFFATAENAVDKEMDRLFSNYMKGKIRYWQAGNCRGNGWIDHACNPYSTGDGLMRKLYRGWSDGKLEDKLKNDYGIQFARRDSDSRLFMEITTPQGLSFVGVDDQGWLDGNDTLDDLFRDNSGWSPAKRQEIRLAVKQALQHETRYKQVMYRIKVGKLLERKYGVKRCIIGCKYRDNYADWKDDKKRAMKMATAQRVLAPKMAMYLYLFDCMLTPGKCSAADFDQPTAGPYSATAGGCDGGCEDNGETQSRADRAIRSTILVPRILSHYDGDVEKMRSDYNNFRGGLSGLLGRYVNGLTGDDDNTTRGTRILDRLATSQAIQRAKYAIPIVGQIDLAANIVGTIDILATAMPKMVYVMNTTAAAQFFSMYRTTADEMKEGQVDNTIFGSFVEGIGPGVQIDATEESQVGGTGGAEQSPLYGELIGKNPPTKLSSLFNDTVLAQSSADYRCADRELIEAGKLICDEEKIQQDGNTAAEWLNRLTNNPAFSFLAGIADLWNGVVGTIVGGIVGAIQEGISAYFSFLCRFDPFGICDSAEEKAEQVIGAVNGIAKDLLVESLKFIFQTVFGYNVEQITTHMSGAKTFNAMTSGANVAGNEFSHIGLGGRVLSAQEVAAIVNEQETERQLAYKKQSLSKKLFDTDNSMSVVSRFALAMPTTKKDFAPTNLLNYMKSSFASLFGIFTSGLDRGAKAQNVIEDPFGVRQYGYTDNDPTLEIDPEIFWNQNCTTENDGGSDVTRWSLTKLYNTYSSFNLDDSYTPINDSPRTNFDNPINNAIAQAFLTKSPNGTNRCFLIQAAVGSGGAVFTDDTLTPDERGQGSSSATTPPGTTPPGGNLPPPTGADQSSTQCDSRTRDIGIYQGYQNGSPIQIRLCALPNLPSTGQESNGGYNVSGGNGQALVNAAVSRNFYELVEAANAALPSNLRMSANSSFRTMAHQEELCRQDDKCPGGDYSDVARPGTSNHQMGLAIDFDIKGISESVSSCIREGAFCSARGFQDWEWLNSNATRFGLRQYSNEFWHFSPTGS